MWCRFFLLDALVLFSAAAHAKSARNVSPKFISTRNAQFSVNDTDFKFLGTTAYWLSALNTEQDINNTLTSMSAQRVKVVRTWAFNDVTSVPDDNSTWFQLISPNGTTTVNTGSNGLAKLDYAVKTAESLGMYLHLSLTNNWNPVPFNDTEASGDTLARRDITQGSNHSVTRNTLSNDYGGMDAYVRAFGGGALQHDHFYTNETLIKAFENYTSQVVSRYVDSPAIFAWEIANDPRCNSTISASSDCQPQTVTRWHSRIAKHIRTIDPNHLIASGTHGFFCVGCPKLFPRTAPPPQVSARADHGPIRRKPAPLTRARILEERKRAIQESAKARADTFITFKGPKIRGRWSAPAAAKRQSTDLQVGNAYDGSHGVDSEDILNIPELGFGTFQLFPDQNMYEQANPNLDAFNQTLQMGTDWIKRQADTGAIFGKPVSLTGFGLVTKDNAPSFVPFNSSQALFNTTLSNATFPTNSTGNSTFGVTNQQRDDAYSHWIDTGVSSGLSGMIHYQWGQSNLTSQAGSAVVPNQSNTTQSGNINESGISPNDGYSTQGVGQDVFQTTFQQGAQEIGNSTA